VEKQRFIAHDDELVERDPAGRPIGQVGRDTVDPLGDLGGSGSGIGVGGHVMTVPAVRRRHHPNLLGWA
jgi:hypothetical protein